MVEHDGERSVGGSAALALEGRPRELAILNAIAEALNSSADVRQALERTLALVANLLELRTAWVWLLNPETGKFYLAASQNLPPFLQEPVRMSDQMCVCIESFRHGHLTPRNVEVWSCSRLAAAYTEHVPEAVLGLRYHASIPLYFQDRPLGIINVTGPSERRLTADELTLLATIAYQVGIAVERARLAEEATRLARAEERTRIAREIHDTLAQDLTAIGLDIEGALRHLEDSPEQSRRRLERALATAHESLEEARRSVFDLRGGPPAGRSLADAIVALGRTFTSDTGVPLHMQAGQALTLPLRVEAELYRVAQEALANVRKHARATVVEAELRATPKEVELSFRDDGVGFNSTRASVRGAGLTGIRERVKLVHGRLRIESRPGLGTKLTVRVPLPLDDEP